MEFDSETVPTEKDDLMKTEEESEEGLESEKSKDEAARELKEALEESKMEGIMLNDSLTAELAQAKGRIQELWKISCIQLSEFDASLMAKEEEMIQLEQAGITIATSGGTGMPMHPTGVVPSPTAAGVHPTGVVPSLTVARVHPTGGVVPSPTVTGVRPTGGVVSSLTMHPTGLDSPSAVLPTVAPTAGVCPSLALATRASVLPTGVSSTLSGGMLPPPMTWRLLTTSAPPMLKPRPYQWIPSQGATQS